MEQLVLPAFFRINKGGMVIEERLNNEERSFAEKHHNLVYKFLNNSKLNENEYYDVAVLAYLNAIRRYFVNEKLRKYKFSTIAWRAMKNAVVKDKRKNQLMFISLDEQISQRYELADKSLMKSEIYDENLVYMELLAQVSSILTEKQRKTLLKRVDGYKYSDMAKVAKISNSGIGSRLSRARKKMKKLFNRKGEEK